ncbi:hypothetical protein R1sor_022331 [Riccia sorocarpa]|uniref:Uncharacterized protein n=1 Tax=Riccia sorocarpa TaxID=122646 RepID=A0ABD3GMW1_9MARC
MDRGTSLVASPECFCGSEGSPLAMEDPRLVATSVLGSAGSPDLYVSCPPVCELDDLLAPPGRFDPAQTDQAPRKGSLYGAGTAPSFGSGGVELLPF